MVWELLVFWALRAFTYVILGFGVLIFSIIIYKGAPPSSAHSASTGTAPFIHNDFLFSKPQTLHVFEVNGKVERMSADQFYAATTPAAANPSVAPAIDPAQITDHETYSYAAGGIWPQIVGTVLLVIGSMFIALVLGICSAIYLSEYKPPGPHHPRHPSRHHQSRRRSLHRFRPFRRRPVRPGAEVERLAHGRLVHLAFMILPVVITASEESLRAVPRGFREGALALGATRWQTIWSQRPALRHARHPHLIGPRHRPRRRRDRAHPLHRPLTPPATSCRGEMDITPADLAPGLLGLPRISFAWLHSYRL